MKRVDMWKDENHRCSGTCDECGQHWHEDDISWLIARLEGIENKLKYLYESQLFSTKNRKGEKK